VTHDGTIWVAFRGRIGSFAIDAAFEVPARGVTALFGPSGCGKTTVLRAMAGLHRFADGFCAVGRDTWQDGASFRPPHRRPVGYVFQEASLFPHLSVRGNLMYGARGANAANVPSFNFETTVELLGLAPLLDRGPAHLSGGERQRVAIGRALLSRPRLLLMDEPLSALDRASRDEILPVLERLHALDLPIILVSHDRVEVERLADTLVAMRNGRVEAVGALSDLQSDPSLPFALARDAAVTLMAQVEHYDAGYGLATVADRGIKLLVPCGPVSPGERRRLSIAAGDVSLTRTASDASTILNVLPVTIASATSAGDHALLVVLHPSPEGPRLLARVTRLSWDQLGLAVGDRVHAQVKSVALAAR
jgi:molybdate transport system ATP-binding protein